MINLDLDNAEVALLVSIVVENSRNTVDDDIFATQSARLFHAVMDAVRSSKAVK
jgi:hypothetical protein